MRIFSLILLLTLVGLGSVSQAQAPAKIESLIVQANLLSDGQLQVTQEIRSDWPIPLAWPIYSNINNLKVEADQTVLEPKLYQIKNHNGYKLVQSSKMAYDWSVSYQTTSTLIRQHSRDQLFLKILQNSGQFVEDVNVTLSLPKTDVPIDLQGNTYTISGVDDVSTEIVNDNTVQYRAAYAGPASTFTISANWPKHVLALNYFQEVKLAVGELQLMPWLLLGLFLPIATAGLLVSLILRRQRLESSPNATTKSPPSAISPMLVGVVVRKKIQPEVIVALLIDLCQRGYLIIINKGGDYFLSQRRIPDDALEIWEREIIEQLFPHSNGKTTIQKTQDAKSDALFSPNVRDAFRRVYEVITQKQIFIENPHLTRIRYKLFALAIYFVSTASLIWVAASNQSPLMIIPLSGVIVMAILILKLSPKLVRYTEKGRQEHDSWIAFGNFLRLPEPLPMEAARNQTFDKYLPYAVALGCAQEWAGRFDLSKTALVKPDWLVSYRDETTVEIAQEVTSFTKKISDELTTLRGPLVS